MSLVSKDSIIKACADAYKAGTGSESVKVGELSEKILEAILSGASGGGLPEGWATGEFTTTAETMFGGFNVEHGLGAIPHVVFVFKDSSVRVTNSIRGSVRFQTDEDYDEEIGNYMATVRQRIFYDTAANFADIAGSYDYDDTAETFCVSTGNSSTFYTPGQSYRWVAVRLEA